MSIPVYSMLVSKKQGTRYGLIQPKQKATPKPVQASLSVFADEEDTAAEQVSNVAQDVAKQAARKRQNAKVTPLRLTVGTVFHLQFIFP